MPTKKGKIWAQWLGYSDPLGFSPSIAGVMLHSISVYPNHRDITAYSALSSVFHEHEPQSGPGDAPVWKYAGIREVISQGALEEFFMPIPFIIRKDVTKVTFLTASSDGHTCYALHVINYWN